MSPNEWRRTLAWAIVHAEARATWLSAMQTVTSGTAPEIAEGVDDVPF